MTSKKVEKKVVSVSIKAVPESLWKRARVFAVKEGRTTGDVVSAALEEYLKIKK